MVSLLQIYITQAGIQHIAPSKCPSPTPTCVVLLVQRFPASERKHWNCEGEESKFLILAVSGVEKGVNCTWAYPEQQKE